MRSALPGVALLFALSALARGSFASAAVLLLFALPASAQVTADAAAFKRAIEDHLTKTTGSRSRPCVTLWKVAPKKSVAFPDTRFDWTPASFIIRLDQEADPDGYFGRVFGFAARHGYFESRPVPGGALEYRMTWKGYAHTNGQGCFYTGGSDAEITVQSFEHKGGATWNVLATGRPRHMLPWAADPEFRQRFTSYSDHRPEFGTNSYEITSSGFGFAVVDRRPPPETLGVPRVLMRVDAMFRKREPGPEEIAKAAGVLTRERVLAVLNDYVTKPYAVSNRVCIWLPRGDETNLDDVMKTPEEQTPAPLQFTIYNYRRLAGYVDVTREYDLLTRLDSAGLVKSERIPATEFRGQKADGAIRFTLTDAGRAMIPRDQPTCLLTGHVEPVEVLDYEQFTPTNSVPGFVARTKFKPLPGREALLARFRHVERLTETGGGMVGDIHFISGKLEGQGSYSNPEFEVERSQLPPLPFERVAR